MSFWDLSDNEDATKSGGDYDSGGGSFEDIPNNTDVMACPDEAKWDKDNENNEFLSIRWTVLKPEQYANRKVFQKMWVNGNNPRSKNPKEQGDKAKRMLAAIDANAGGKLAGSTSKPTDETLTMALVNKPMVLKLMVWEMEGTDGKPMSGNWVCAVSPKSKGLTATGDAPKLRAAAPTTPDGDMDDIPF